MITDSHAHIGDFPLFHVKLDAMGLIAIMNKWKIGKALVSALPNTLTLNAIKEHKDRIAGLVWVNPHQGDKATTLVEEAITKWGFKGIKMHPLIDAYLPDQKIVYPIMDRAQKHQVPVLFHCGHPPWSLPWHFENLADIYPQTTIILGHMGHGHIVYINGAIEVARRHENIVLETSGMPMHSKIKEAVNKVGENRVLYGSDMPFGHPAFEIKKVEVAGLTKKQRNLVFKENAREIFQL